ncbi:MAG: DUF1385 domain-containing protein [Clostridiales bacterium]|nr:DUF1385 domain-containing protein [Clostridiales bacterium]
MAAQPLYGGQALIEGVMMRGPQVAAMAVRRPDGGIEIRVEKLGQWAHRVPGGRWPLVRGVVGLVESLAVGLGALSFSANVASPEEEQLTPGQVRWTMVLSALLAVAIFVILPTWVTGFLVRWGWSHLALNMAEGLLRVILLVGYLLLISRMEEIQRVLQYHGAEHKTIAAFEAGAPLTPRSVQQFPRFHPRCGTSYLLFVALVAVFIFSFLGWPSLFWRVTSRLLLLPLVAGLAYEVLRLSAKGGEALWARAVAAPGLWMQRWTTREPDEGQLEVAIAAFMAVREAEGHGEVREA